MSYGKVYLVYNTVTNKYYVGQTTRTSVIERWKQHIYLAQAGAATYFARSIRKHGAQTFEIYELAAADSLEELDNLERLWILLSGSWQPSVGYNCRFGGGGGKWTDNMPESTRQTIKDGARAGQVRRWYKARIKHEATIQARNDLIRQRLKTKVLKLRDRSCSPDEATMDAAIMGHPEAQAIIESWRFRFPVTQVKQIPDNPFSL